MIEGRRTFANMLKYIKMTASSNFGNVFSVLVASAFLPFLPMLPLHLLIQNLLYDVSQVAIPFDNVDDEQIRKPQRWNPADLGRFMVFFGPISSIFDILTFGLMWWVFHANTVEMQTLFQSGWFIEGAAVADADCAHDPHPAHSVRSEPRRVAAVRHDSGGDGRGHCPAVLAAGGLPAAAGAAAQLLPVAGGDPGGLYGADPDR